MEFACAILSFVACLTEQYFSTLSHKGMIFEKILNIERVFGLSLELLSETFLILRRTE